MVVGVLEISVQVRGVWKRGHVGFGRGSGGGDVVRWR
jgi:hypothetical protein